MDIRGNKGEWSEIYTLFKLLGDGVMYAGDQNMNKIKDLFYPIIRILRHEEDGDYNYNLNDKNVVIQKSNGDDLLRIPASVFLENAENLLNEINSNDGAFALPSIEEFMNSIYCHSLKAKSSDKTDIRIVLHDIRTKINSEMGFSIKSQLGHNSTLLNASKATNFIYKIQNVNFTDDEILTINSIDPHKGKVIERYKAIVEKGGNLVYDRVENKIFKSNLRMLDGDMDKLIAEMLITQLNFQVATLPELIALIAEKDILNFGEINPIDMYTYKVKHLLSSAALGMMPATKWNGMFDANGGYIVVREDGEIVCYHFYDRNRFESYLFANAYLERSSTSRHDYAYIKKEEDGTFSFKLNLQIRLK